MSNKKQSSIEWLMQEIAVKYGTFQAIAFYHEFNEILERAKAMHKEEIEEAYDAVIIDENGGLLDGKEYYKQTFGGNNE